MKIVRGDTLEELGSAEFERIAAAYSGLWLDIGTGDGSFVYQQARDHSTVLCLGLDPAWTNMSRMANRATRRKTAAPNAFFVQGSVDDLPPELIGRADSISINYPWSGLLRALVAPDARILGNIRALARAGAEISVFLNLHVFQDEGLKESLALPALDADYVGNVLVPAYREKGLAIVSFDLCEDKLPVKTTWGSRLSLNSRRASCSLLLKAT